MTIDEALNHTMFNKVRDKSKEKVSEEPVVLDFEKEEELEVPRLRELFVGEIHKYHKKWRTKLY